MHCGAEVTESSTNKQHHLSYSITHTHTQFSNLYTSGLDCLGCGRALEIGRQINVLQDIRHGPTRSLAGVEWLGVCCRGLLPSSQPLPGTFPEMEKDVRKCNTPVSGGLTTGGYIHTEQQAGDRPGCRLSQACQADLCFFVSCLCCLEPRCLLRFLSCILQFLSSICCSLLHPLTLQRLKYLRQHSLLAQSLLFG